MTQVLEHYGILLEEVSSWFTRCQESFPEDIACSQGCSDCCRGLFDITLLDACYLKSGFDRLPPAVKRRVRSRARVRLLELQGIWPDLTAPYLLNFHPEGEWDALMPDDDETPCVLLGDNGRCLVYDHRPMTCRLHGLPLIDVSGEVMHDEWCTLNFNTRDPLGTEGLHGEFISLFRRELALFREYTGELLGERMNELDTLIPTAVLIDFRRHPWQSWWLRNRESLVASPLLT
jgi:Fe-S-cluster containining protein